jgi:hypothetical protein
MHRWRLIAGFTLISLAVCVAWLFQTSRGLGVTGQWTITPHEWWPIGAWGLPLVVLFLFGGLAALSAYDCFMRAKSPKESRQSAGLCIGALTLFAILWPWFLLGPSGTQNLISASFSDVSNQYFAAAWQMQNVRDYTRDYAGKEQKPPSLMLAHVATHPPGAVLFYAGARYLYEAIPPLKSTFNGLPCWLTQDDLATAALTANAARRTANRVAGDPHTPADLPLDAVGGAIFSAFLLSLAVAFCVPAIFWLATLGEENLKLHRARGMTAAALFAIAPTVGLFTFTIDALIAAGILWALLFLALGLEREKYFWLVLSGALAGLMCFVSFGALAVLAIMGIVVLWHRHRSWIAALVLALSFVGIWGVLQAIFPMQSLLIFKQAMAAHRFATLQSRTWEMWVWINAIVFAVFAGLPLWWMSLVNAVETLRNKCRQIAIGQQIGIATFAVMLLLTLSGGARGEVERLWFCLIAPLAILASQHLREESLSRKKIYLLSALLAAGCIQTILMATALGPLVRPF